MQSKSDLLLIKTILNKPKTLNKNTMKNKVIIATFLLLVTTLFAQRPGDLYENFSGDGIFNEDWIDTSTITHSIRVMPNGNLIIPGCYKLAGSDLQQMMVLGLNNQGHQIQFGNSTIGFEYDLSESENVNSVYILPDNKMLINGNFMIGTNYHNFIMRLLPDGQLDSEFADNGIYIDSITQIDFSIMDVYFNEDSYYIVLAGWNIRYQQLMMIDDDGILVTNFGSEGFYQFTKFKGTPTDLTIDSRNNCLYFAGKGYVVDSTSIVKLHLPDGIPDANFGVDGALCSSAADGFNGTISAIVLDKTGSTLTSFGAYEHPAGDYDIFAYRVNTSDGSDDPTFGQGGWASLRSPTSWDVIRSAVLQSDGKYIFGGITDFNGTHDFLLGRIQENGFSDSTFGTNGIVLTDFGLNDESLYELALSPTENIIYAAGYTTDIEDGAIMVAAYYTGYETEPIVNSIDNKVGLISCYPNPFSGNVTIETGVTGPQVVQLYDLTGKELFRGNYQDNKFDLYLEFLQCSIYLVKIIMPDSNIKILKLIKQ